VSAIDHYRRCAKLLAEFRKDMENECDYITVSLDSPYNGYAPDHWFGEVMSEVVRSRRGSLLEETFAKLEAQVEKLRKVAEDEARSFMEGKA
jgi:hypothetical protein